MQVVIELPYIFVQTIIYGVIVYAMIGFDWTVSKFFWYIFFMYFTFLYFTFYGMMAVAVTPNHNISAIVSSAFYAIWNLFSGFIIPRTVSFNNPLCMFFFFQYTKWNNNLHGPNLVCDRGCQSGGDGTIGFVQSLGPCMGWLLHSLETLRTHLIQVRSWKIFCWVILDIETTLWVLLQLWLLEFQCSLDSPLPIQLRHLTSKRDENVML